MSQIDRSETFVQHIVKGQVGLYAYILTLLPDPNDASDVLQQTNMALWRDAGRFTEGTSFNAWSMRVAYFKVLEFRERNGRERRRFRDTLLEALAEEATAINVSHEERLAAMRECLSQMPSQQRDLVNRRYCENETVKSIATAINENANVIANRLYRIRRSLWTCIQGRLAMRGEE